VPASFLILLHIVEHETGRLILASVPTLFFSETEETVCSESFIVDEIRECAGLTRKVKSFVAILKSIFYFG